MNNKRTIMMSVLMIAASLIFANSNVASAETTKTVDGEDKRVLDAIERKRAEAANKIVIALQEYQQSLNEHKFTNKNTERRVMEDTDSIQNKINGIVSLLRNTVTPTVATENPNEPSSEIIKIHKLRNGQPGGTDIARVIYKITAGDNNLRDAIVTVDSKVDKVEKTVSLFANTQTTHALFMKVKDPNSVSVTIQ